MSHKVAKARMDEIVKKAWVSGRPLLIGTASTLASESIYRSVKAALQKEEEAQYFRFLHCKERGAALCLCRLAASG